MVDQLTIIKPVTESLLKLEAAYRMPTTPPINRSCTVSESVYEVFYFVELIFLVCQSTVKAAKIGSLESFQLYRITLNVHMHNVMVISLSVCYQSTDC